MQNYIVEDKSIIVQKLEYKADSSIDRARKYYSALFALNNIKIPEMQLNMLSFIAARGTISSGGAKAQFCQMFSTTKASIGNVIFKLTKKGYLVKVNNRTKVVDGLQLDFSREILLSVKILRDAS